MDPGVRACLLLMRLASEPGADAATSVADARAAVCLVAGSAHPAAAKQGRAHSGPPWAAGTGQLFLELAEVLGQPAPGGACEDPPQGCLPDPLG